MTRPLRPGEITREHGRLFRITRMTDEPIDSDPFRHSCALSIWARLLHLLPARATWVTLAVAAVFFTVWALTLSGLY